MMIMVTVINSGDSGDNGDCDDCDDDDCADDHDNDAGHTDDISLWTWCLFTFSRWWCTPESWALFMVASMTPTKNP